MTADPERAKRSGAASGATRVQRFRAQHRRFDYVPCPEALKVIDTWVRANPSMSLSRIIDHLIVAGNAALIAGNPAAVR